MSNITITNVGRNITCQNWGTDPLQGLRWSTGGIVLDHDSGKPTPVVCGGRWDKNKTEENKCYAIRPSGVEVVAEMKTPRYGAASIVVNGSLLVTGGSSLNTTEMISISVPSIPGPPLKPSLFFGHCFVKLNQSHAVAIAEFGGDVYLYDIANQTWLPLASPPSRSNIDLCGHLVDSTLFDDIVIAIDMFGTVYHAVFDPVDGFTWNCGPQPDFRIAYRAKGARVVTSSNDRKLFFIGLNEENPTEMYQMGGTRRECIWQPMIESVDFAREDFVAIIVPDELTECTTSPLDILGIVLLALFVAIMVLPCLCDCRFL